MLKETSMDYIVLLCNKIGYLYFLSYVNLRKNTSISYFTLSGMASISNSVPI